MRLLMKVVAIYLFLLVTLDLDAQPAPDTLWTQVYGGRDADWGMAVQQTWDLGFIAVGTTRSFGAGEEDMLVVKTDSLGQRVWVHTFGGMMWDGANAVCETADGFFAIAGVSYFSGITGSANYLLLLDVNGDTLWTRVYWQALNDGTADMDATSDDGFILTGWTGDGVRRNAYLFKIDSNGDAQWARTYVNTNNTQANSVRQTTDGGYILAGYAEDSTAFGSEFYVMKTDSQGNSEWSHTYDATGTDIFQSVRQTQDGGYILAGIKSVELQRRMYLLKLNSAGDSLWSRTFEPNYYGANSIEQTADGGYLMVGDGMGADNTQDVVVVKTDSIGNIIWSQTYGGPLEDSGQDAGLTFDGGAIVAGCMGTVMTPDADMYLIRLSSFIPDDANPVILQPASFHFAIFPNPFNASATINFSLSRTAPTELVIFNLLGEKTATLVNGLREAGAHRVIWTAENYPSGIYFARLRAGQTMQTVRVVLAK